MVETHGKPLDAIVYTYNLHTDKKIIWNLFIIKYVRDCRESDMQMPAFQRQ